MTFNIAISLAIAIVSAALWLPWLRNRATWRAMITPLASIIGSGFLILGPVLAHAYGGYAPLAMLLLCLVAWGFGAAIRFNISEIGERLDTGEARGAETVASALLGFAYMVSVAYYLNLFGAFALSLTPFDSAFNARLLTTAIYALILVTGWTKGFGMLESMEYASVSLKLAIIAGLLVGLVAFAWGKAVTGTLVVSPPSIGGWGAITLGFGLIVTVQGFETSRYLGHTYGPDTRIRSMMLAQVVATAIYIAYILLIAYSFAPVEVALDETAIIDMMGLVAPILPALLVAAALAAQFSAAVADTGGAGGLIAELSRDRLRPRQAYVLVVAVGLAITWSADVFEIISHASRAFAAYYTVQSGLAAWRAGSKSPIRAGLFAVLAVLGAAIVLFGQPVE